MLLFLWSISETASMASINADITIVATFDALIWVAIRCYIPLKIIFEIKKYSWREIAVLIAIATVGYFSSFYSESGFLTAAFWFIAGAKGIDWKKAVKLLLKAQIIALIIIISCCFMGILPDNSKMGTDSGNVVSGIGHSLGYYHPNDLAGNVLQIVLMMLYVMKRPLRLRVPAAFLSIAVITYLITKSGTSSCLIVFISLMLVFFSVGENGNIIGNFISENLAKALKYVVVVLAICSVLFSVRQDIGESILGDFHSRIAQMAAYFAYYKITPWGQPLLNHTSIDYDWRTNLYTLDNAYVHLLLGFGYVVFTLFILFYIRLIWRTYKSKQYVLLLILVTYAVLGFTETMFIRVQYNFTILLFAQIIWNNKLDDTVYSSDRLGEFS